MSRRKKIIFTCIAIILALFVIEIGLHAATFLISLHGVQDPHYILSSFNQTSWAPGFFKENAVLSSAFKSYTPYVEWTTKEFNGQYTNVDAYGRRATWNPTTFAGTTKIVDVFGGSTVWGTGVRDDYTVPSQISQLLNVSSSHYLVYNYGQDSYVTDQEIFKLILLLKSGQIPDYVIVYDGFNTVAAAFQNGEASGTLLNENVVREKLEGSFWKNAYSNTLQVLHDNCELCKVAVDVARWTNPNFLRPANQAEGLDTATLGTMAQGVAADYLSSVDLLDKLSREYHFKYLVFWQPNIFLEKQRVGDESKLPLIDPTVNDKSLGYLQNAVLADLRTDNTNPHFYDISDALSARTQQVYIDEAHLSEPGNGMIASRIVSIFKKNFSTP